MEDLERRMYTESPPELSVDDLFRKTFTDIKNGHVKKVIETLGNHYNLLPLPEYNPFLVRT
jgi:hypothetical protein